MIDGFEGMEGNGPSMGTPVPSRVAIASTDYIAADRVGIECMGINPLWVAHEQWCWQTPTNRGRELKFSPRPPIVSLRRPARAQH